MRTLTSIPVRVAVALAVLTLAGCASAPSAPPSSRSASPTTTQSATPTPSPTLDPLAGLSLEERVGQVFMVGASLAGPERSALAAVRERHVGSVFLHGRTHGGVDAVAGVVTRIEAAGATAGIPLWIATDQEGGEVQALRGPGFDDIPYAIRQADRPPAELRRAAERWGRQLARAGLNMNLAPVADIVTSRDTRFDNPPIGGLGRQYGYDESTVAARAGAFADGMRAAGILPTFKHFPGLGHVTANTDTTDHVVDTVVGADSSDVDVYRPLTAAGPSVVMVGTAIYRRIDGTAPAAFSRAVVTGVLRDRVGFAGVVMTDDLSAAAAVQDIPMRERAVRALDAGVDVVLVSADPGALAAMYQGVLSRARSDPAFAERVDEAARRVVGAKADPP